MGFRIMPISLNWLVLFAVERLEICRQSVVYFEISVYGRFGISQALQTLEVKRSSPRF